MNVKNFFSEKNEKFILWIGLFMGGTIIRLIIGIFFSSGMIHPDEIFQSREIAHSWLYPKMPAIIPWEFKKTKIGGDGSARSVIFPLVVYIIMAVCDFLNLNYWNHTLLILRAFFAFISAFLIPAMYYLTKELFSDSRVSYLTSFLVAVYYLFPFFGIRSLTNSFYVPFMVLGWYLFLIGRRKLQERFKNEHTYKDLIGIIYLLLAGILFGFCFMIRLDSLVFIGFFFLVYFNFYNISDYVSSGIIATSFFFMVVIQGISDLLYYGTFLISPINWFIFNIVENKSANFGVSSGAYYFYEIAMRSFLLIILLLILFFLGKQVNKAVCNSYQINNEEQINLNRLLSLILWSMGPIILFSIPGHKEFRFIFPALPAFMILSAMVLLIYSDMVVKITSKSLLFLSNLLNRFFEMKIPERKIKQCIEVGMFVFLVCSIAFVSVHDGSKEDWNVLGDIFHAMEWVGQQDNSTGLFVFAPWFWTGGYSSLHKNISVSFDGDISRALQVGDWKYRDTINYLICPHYQYLFEPNATEVLNSYGFHFIKTIDGRTDVFYRSS